MKLMKINHMNIRMMLHQIWDENKERSTSAALFNGLLFMVHAYFYHFHHFTYVHYVIRESVIIMIIFHFFFRSRVFHIKYVFPFPYVYSFILFVLFWALCCLISSSSDHLLYILIVHDTRFTNISRKFFLFNFPSFSTSIIIFALSVPFEIFELHATSSSILKLFHFTSFYNSSSNNNDNNNDEMQARHNTSYFLIRY